MGITPFVAVIPTYGERGIPLTLRCVETFWKYHLPDQGRIVVVDDGSPVEITQAMAISLRTFPNVTVIRSDVNGGFAHACNIGIQNATSMAVTILVNNDIEFISPACAQVTDYVAQTNCGIAGIRLLYPDRTIQHGGVVYKPENGGYFDHILRGGPAHHPLANQVANRLVTGAFFAIHPRAIAVNGLLDGRYGMAVEDIDYCLQCIVARLPVKYNGTIEAIHHEGRTRGRTMEEKQQYPEALAREQMGLQMFMERWQGIDLMRFSGADYGNI